MWLAFSEENQIEFKKFSQNGECENFPLLHHSPNSFYLADRGTIGNESKGAKLPYNAKCPPPLNPLPLAPPSSIPAPLALPIDPIETMCGQKHFYCWERQSASVHPNGIAASTKRSKSTNPMPIHHPHLLPIRPVGWRRPFSPPFPPSPSLCAASLCALICRLRPFIISRRAIE